MSQSQEIGKIYKELKEINNGLDVEELMYGVDGFYYNKFPKEWNRTFSKIKGIEAPETTDEESGFAGDPIYCEHLWLEFKYWTRIFKDVIIKDFADVEYEKRGLPLEVKIPWDELEDTEEIHDAACIYFMKKFGYSINSAAYDVDWNTHTVTVYFIEWNIKDNEDIF